jgi:hypothetical protein
MQLDLFPTSPARAFTGEKKRIADWIAQVVGGPKVPTFLVDILEVTKVKGRTRVRMVVFDGLEEMMYIGLPEPGYMGGTMQWIDCKNDAFYFDNHTGRWKRDPEWRSLHEVA